MGTQNMMLWRVAACTFIAITAAAPAFDNAEPAVHGKPHSGQDADGGHNGAASELYQKRKEQLHKISFEIGSFNASVHTTIKPRTRDTEENLPTIERHEISGQFEDIGGHHEVREEKDQKPRGREWRKQLAEKMNRERMSRWRKGEEKARVHIHTLRDAEKSGNFTAMH